MLHPAFVLWPQFLKQMYVLVLGLDVLGNPFGLIRGLSEGVEAFFYEPFQVTVNHRYTFHHRHRTQVRSPFVPLGPPAPMLIVSLARNRLNIRGKFPN